MEEKDTLQPPLKWAGGKRWLADTIAELYAPHRHRRLVEPFVGGLAIALTLKPERALLNDINPHLINFYRWLQRGLRIDIVLENDPEVYYRHRERFNALIRGGKWETKEAAELFYYLNRTGYNGLCRFNRRGEFNVPFGRYKRISYVRDFTPYRPLLEKWVFTQGDFEQVPLDPDDFIYADPPYDVEFTKYAKEGFSWNDQVRLAYWLARHPGPVVASNQATSRILELYRDLGFKVWIVKAPRRIACNGDRTPADEMVALKP
ncbi:adenine methyltransferase [Thermus scotoductus]|uniref:Site-specific DNA-methyltransferase (adenine-specific) n=1 Tax=Thermus scotoductus TaxID=37636 RepID=A0A0N0ZSB9_THESC|nr:adenine methyltransferase [Thermus scotoductus]